MALSVFEDKLLKPSDEDINRVLGESRILWDEVKKYIIENNNPVIEEWKNYGKTSGWTLLIKQKKRTLLYLFPSTGYFIVQFVFSEKAVEKALNSELPLSIIVSIEDAHPYVEGRSFRVEVKNKMDLAIIKQLIDIKVNL